MTDIEKQIKAIMCKALADKMDKVMIETVPNEEFQELVTELWDKAEDIAGYGLTVKEAFAQLVAEIVIKEMEKTSEEARKRFVLY